MKLLILLALSLAASASAQFKGIPRLARQGANSVVLVDDKPFLMFAAELHNSSSSNLDYM